MASCVPHNLHLPHQQQILSSSQGVCASSCKSTVMKLTSWADCQRLAGARRGLVQQARVRRLFRESQVPTHQCFRLQSPRIMQQDTLAFTVHAAWTRRSSGEPKKKSRKSWKRRTDKYMKPFSIDVYISARYVNAKVVHRVTSKVVAVATTSAKDLRMSLPSTSSFKACEVIGELIAERAKEADVYAVAYEPRKNERLEGKLAAVLNTVAENGVAVL